jgi:hypothetical protein
VDIHAAVSKDFTSFDEVNQKRAKTVAQAFTVQIG